MKSKSKRPKLKKYAYGAFKKPVTPAAIQNDPNYIPSDGNDMGGDGTNQSNNGLNAGQYAAIGASLAGGGASLYSNLNDPNASLRQKSESLDNTTVGVAGAINPLVGGIIAGVNTIAKPIRTQAEQTDENGNLVNHQKAQNMAIVGGLLDPVKALTTRLSYKGGLKDWTGKKYLDNLEAEAKAKLPVAPPETFYKDNSQDAVWQRLNDYQQFAMGGMSNIPNAEIENQEMLKYPDGSTQQFDGPSHSDGGIPVNIPNGTQIFSDRLKLPGSKKTVAKEAEAFKTDKEDKILDDKKSTTLAKNTAALVSKFKQQKLDELFQAQENFKMSKVAKYAEKLGVNLPQINDSSQEYKYGGIHIKKSHEGRFTEYKKRTGKTTEEALHSKDPHVRQMANFARNASHWKHAYGGRHMNCYPNGGETNDPIWNWQYNSPDMSYPNQVPTYTVPGTPADQLTTPNPYNNQTPTVPASDYTDPYASMRNRNIYEGIGNGILQNAGNIYDLYLSNFGKNYDKVDYGQTNPQYFTPRTVSATESLRDADRQAAASRYALQNAVGGNTGAYLANLSANQTANTLNKAKIRESVNNTNTGILNDANLRNTMVRNDAERYNLDLKNRSQIDTAANRARSQDITREAVRGIGENLSAAYRDYKLSENDQQRLKLVNQMFPSYAYNPSNFEFYYRAANQINNKPKRKK